VQGSRRGTQRGRGAVGVRRGTTRARCRVRGATHDAGAMRWGCGAAQRGGGNVGAWGSRGWLGI